MALEGIALPQEYPLLELEPRDEALWNPEGGRSAGMGTPAPMHREGLVLLVEGALDP